MSQHESHRARVHPATFGAVHCCRARAVLLGLGTHGRPPPWGSQNCEPIQSSRQTLGPWSCSCSCKSVSSCPRNCQDQGPKLGGVCGSEEGFVCWESVTDQDWHRAAGNCRSFPGGLGFQVQELQRGARRDGWVQMQVAHLVPGRLGVGEGESRSLPSPAGHPVNSRWTLSVY